MPSRILPSDHNGGVSEATFFRHDRIFTDIDKQRAALAAKTRAAKAAAEDDGLNYDDYKYAKKRRGLTLQQQIDSHNRINLYQRHMGMPIAVKIPQVEQFSDETALSDEDRAAKWTKEGFVAAREGKGMDVSPHDPNSLAGRYWLEGFREGTAKNAEGIKTKKPDAPVVEGKRGRGRPKKDKTPPADSQQPPADEKTLAGDKPETTSEGAAPGDGSSTAAADGGATLPAGATTTDEEWEAANPGKTKPAADDADPFAEGPAAPPAKAKGKAGAASKLN